MKHELLLASALLALATACGSPAENCIANGTCPIEEVPPCTPACGAHASCGENTTCQCLPGYEGDPLAGCGLPGSCDTAPCHNGGTCSELDGGQRYECACAGGYSGATCETPPSVGCLLRYTLSGTMLIRDTSLGLGNFDIPADAKDSPTPEMLGQLTLRLPLQQGAVVNGPVEILSYALHQLFATQVSALGPLVITTDVWAYSPEPRGTVSTVSLATGTLDTTGAANLVSFPDCALPAGYNSSNTSYTPDVVATGAGCLRPYRSVGKVNCNDGSALASCSDGKLMDGDNSQDETWEQPLPEIELSRDFATLAFRSNSGDSAQPGFMLIPNRSPSRTYLRWRGSLDSAASTCDDL